MVDDDGLCKEPFLLFNLNFLPQNVFLILLCNEKLEKVIHISAHAPFMLLQSQCSSPLLLEQTVLECFLFRSSILSLQFLTSDWHF